MHFQVILEHLTPAPSGSPQNICRILSEECGVTILELDEVLDRGPLSVATGLSAEQARSLQQKLEAAGAKVLLVQAQASAAPSQLCSDEETCKTIFDATYTDYHRRLRASLESIDVAQVRTLGFACLQARQAGRQVLIMGNGGSAANASHIANDFLKHGHENARFSFRVLSLTDNVPWMTAISNDLGYQSVFVQQMRNHLCKGDVVIAISSSGNSPNIIEGTRYANTHGATTFAIVGFGGGELAGIARHVVMIPTAKGDYGVMEDGSLIVGHILSEFFANHDRYLAQP